MLVAKEWYVTSWVSGMGGSPIIFFVYMVEKKQFAFSLGLMIKQLPHPMAMGSVLAQANVNFGETVTSAREDCVQQENLFAKKMFLLSQQLLQTISCHSSKVAPWQEN